MVSGFLIRHDGSLITIDSIVWIELKTAPGGNIPNRYNVIVHMIEGHFTQWNREPREEPEIRALLRELVELIRKAIEL